MRSEWTRCGPLGSLNKIPKFIKDLSFCFSDQKVGKEELNHQPLSGAEAPDNLPLVSGLFLRFSKSVAFIEKIIFHGNAVGFQRRVTSVTSKP